MIINQLGRDWHWPEQDVGCRKVVFDWASDLNTVYRFCKKFDVCVQAGGNMGVWPWLLSKKFGRVMTFEADKSCYRYLLKNTEGFPNIHSHWAALWSEEGMAGELKNDQPDNWGAQYMEFREFGGSDMVDTVKIDSFITHACDLIYLDIEGAEFEALKGAIETIKKFKPTIVVEDKGLSERYGTKRGHIGMWLAEFGYTQAARVHRDSILTCK